MSESDKKTMEVLLNRINELSKKVSSTNDSLDNVVNAFSNMKIKIQSHDDRIKVLENNPSTSTNNITNNQQTVQKSTNDNEILARLDRIDTEISRLKSLTASMLLRCDSDSDSSDNPEDSPDFSKNISEDID